MINYDLNYRDDYEQRLAQRKQFFNPENGDAPSMQSLEDSSRITNMGLLVKASIVLTFTGYTLSKALKLTPINPKTKIWRQIVQYTCCVHQIVLNGKQKTIWCTQHVLKLQVNEQFDVILWINWCKNDYLHLTKYYLYSFTIFPTKYSST